MILLGRGLWGGAGGARLVGGRGHGGAGGGPGGNHRGTVGKHRLGRRGSAAGGLQYTVELVRKNLSQLHDDDSNNFSQKLQQEVILIISTLQETIFSRLLNWPVWSHSFETLASF